MPSSNVDPSSEPPPSAQGAPSDSGAVRAGPRKPIARFRPPPVGPHVRRSGDGGYASSNALDGTARTSGCTNENERNTIDSPRTNGRELYGTGNAMSSSHQARSWRIQHTPCYDPPPSSQQPITTTNTNSPPSPSSTTPTVPSSAAPALSPRKFFDPCNSSSTGHQRAENRLSGSTSWRESRSAKLSAQYRGGLSGGEKRVADTVGVGSEDFGKDGRTVNGGWERGASGLRKRMGGQRSLVEVWGARKGVGKAGEGKGGKEMEERKLEGRERVDGRKEGEGSLEQGVRGYTVSPSRDPETHNTSLPPSDPSPDAPKPIFASLSFYINGSTGPSISDHKLKHVIASHGGSLSISLSRRRITHVILGTGSGPGKCGGGLAASKVQKEIQTMRGKGVKFVSVEWVLECVKRGRRVGEAGFGTGVKVAGGGQGSIFGVFGGKA